YQTLLGHGVAPDPSDPDDADTDAGEAQTPHVAAKTPQKPKKAASKRRFPYRKVADLESEIFERERCVEQLQRRLAEPQVVRDGDLSRDLYRQIEQEQAALRQLYEHWEEAAELNW
ncbi:MAG: ABC transporter C-terminal domain-containing protein, partial [Thermoguttaceae bacterium]